MLRVYRATQTLDGYLPDLIYTESKEDAEIIIVGGKKFDLEEFPKLKGIFKTGVGTDNLPFEEAKNRKIRVQLPSENTKSIIYDETASFACYLIMFGLYHMAGDFASWRKEERNSLSNKRLLVMGTGNIGARVIDRMKQFMIVDTYDPLNNDESEVNALLQKADCVSIHLSLIHISEPTRPY